MSDRKSSPKIGGMHPGEFAHELARGWLNQDGSVGLLQPSVERLQTSHSNREGDLNKLENVFTVPNLSPSELIQRAQREIKLTYLFDGLASWDFSRDEDGKVIDYRGKRYEVVTWKPGRDVYTAEVRAHFKEQNADGNTAAFIAWVTEHKPKGYHTSISSDDKQLCRNPESGVLCAPDFNHGGGYRGLGLREVRYDWGGYWVFVAFRELPSV